MNTKKVAKRYANKDKRLDNCAAQIAFMLHETDKTLIKDKVCMEIGGGVAFDTLNRILFVGCKKNNCY